MQFSRRSPARILRSPKHALPHSALSLPATLLLTVLVGAGCHKKPPVENTALPLKPKAPPQISEVDLKSYKPNEAGAIMILMYHRINAKEPDRDLNRQPESFRKDLEDLYKRGYRPVTVSELIENRMDVPPGKTPVVLTFDDSLPTQFKQVVGTDGNPHIDPDCAVGILETFSKAHPDWKSKATFFVLPKEGRNGDPFGQGDSAADKFAYLIKNGYEIANHTSTHSNMRGMQADKVQWELATAVRDIKQISPEATMNTLALPYGNVPHKDATKYLVSGENGGTKYHNNAVLRAAWRPVSAPITMGVKKSLLPYQIAPYDPYRLERVLPDPRQATKAGTFEYWLKYFDENPGQRYVSDGNPAVIAVPKSMKGLVNTAEVKKTGKTLQLYSLTAGSGGGSLSVEGGTSGGTSGGSTGGAGGGGLSVEPGNR